MIEKLLMNLGEGSVIIGIFLILAFRLIFEVVLFLWNLAKKKNELSEKSIKELTTALEHNTKSVEKLDLRIYQAEKMINDFPKLKLDVRRLFTAIKHVAGDDWNEIRKSILDDETL